MASALSRKSGKGRSPNDDVVDTLYTLLAYLIGPNPEPPDLMVVLAGLSARPAEVAP
jgi:hypothetical protein